MFENIINFFKRSAKKPAAIAKSKEAAKERLHLVLMQDRANVSADFLELMKQEIIEVIKKYIDIDESAIDVRLTNKENEDGTNGAPALYANIPIINMKNDLNMIKKKDEEKEEEDKTEEEQPKKAEEKKEEEENKEEIENKEKSVENESEEKNITEDKKEEQK